jgi:hypothetical protein
MSEACDLAQLCCRATMACLICVAHGLHMWPGLHTARLPQPILGNVWLMHNAFSTSEWHSQCIVIASLIDTPSRWQAPPKIDTQLTSANAG